MYKICKENFYINPLKINFISVPFLFPKVVETLNSLCYSRCLLFELILSFSIPATLPMSGFLIYSCTVF